MKECEEKQNSKSPMVPSEREDGPYGDKPQVCTPITPIPSEMQTESYQSFGVHPNFPSLSEDDHEKEAKKKGDTSKVISLPCTVKDVGVDVRGGCVLPSLTPGFILTVPKAPEEGVHNTCP